MSAADWDESRNDPLYGFRRATQGDGEEIAVRVEPDGTALVWLSKKTLKSLAERYSGSPHAGCFWSLSAEVVEALQTVAAVGE